MTSPRIGRFTSVILAVVFVAGCGPKPERSETKPATAPAKTAGTSNQSQPVDGPFSGMADSGEVKQALRGVERALDRSAYDEAAAQLLRIKLGGVQFSQNDGAGYRTALSEVYSKALEAAGKGDQRGQAAVKMIRAAGPR